MPKIDNRNPVLSIDALSFSYPGSHEPALSNISITLHPNTINMLIGPNGSGKSTLVKLIIGILDGKGTINFFKNDTEISRKEAHIGYVPQNVSIDTTIPITVHELLTLTQKSCNRCKHDSGREITKALKKVDALEYQNRKIGDLSGGQLRRVILARALLNQPRILILDEPEAGIDLQGERFFYEVLHNLVKSEDITALIATHEMEIVSEYADNVICINKSLVCEGSVEETLIPKTFEKLYGAKTRVHAHKHDHSYEHKGKRK
jgi:ABC-type Mn2+/Zn2+ transport system ATPase subunit